MITKKEIIWREILKKATQREQLEFIQKDLAQKFGFSVSTVFNALRIPRSQGAVKVTGRNFLVVDAEKLLYIWATQRNLEKDLIYKTFSPANAKEIEGLMPPGIIFGAYSAFVHKFGDAPADYDKVYVYAGEFELAEQKKGSPRLRVIRTFLRCGKTIFWKRRTESLLPSRLSLTCGILRTGTPVNF